MVSYPLSSRRRAVRTRNSWPLLDSQIDGPHRGGPSAVAGLERIEDGLRLGREDAPRRLGSPAEAVRDAMADGFVT